MDEGGLDLSTLQDPAEARDEGTGRFVAGRSGNPLGRPKGSKNVLSVMQKELQVAIIEYVSPYKIKKILDKMVSLALDGDVKAAKLLLDKIVPNAENAKDEGEAGKTIVFRIENVSLTTPQAPIVMESPPLLEDKTNVVDAPFRLIPQITTTTNE